MSNINKELSPNSTSLIITLVACASHYYICSAATSNIALDIDPVNFIYGMREFNIAHHAPHPPGYLVYVWMLRGLHTIVGGDPLQTVQLMARLLSTATVPLVYFSVRLLRPNDPFSAGFASILTAFHPFLVFHGIDAQIHTSEAFAGALLLISVISYRKAPSAKWAATIGAVLALGSSFRPSFIVAGIGPIIWAIGFRRFFHLCVAGFVSGIGAIVWIIPTLEASGGFAKWKAANDALVSQIFIGPISPLSSEANPILAAYCFLNTTFWLLLALAPVFTALIAARIGRKSAPDAAYKQAVSIAFFSAAPSAVFYLSLFCSEPGYFLGFIPSLIALTVLASTPDLTIKMRRLTFALATLVQIGVLMMPSAMRHNSKVPSIPEIADRQAYYEMVLKRIVDQMPKQGRILYITDFPDIIISRQLPMLYPNIHSMIYHSEYWPGAKGTCIAYATQDDWIPIPGPALRQIGPPTIKDMPFTYDYIVLDPVASPDLRKELRKYSRCNIEEISDEEKMLVFQAKRCFPEGLIEAHGQGIRFKVPDKELE